MMTVQYAKKIIAIIKDSTYAAVKRKPEIFQASPDSNPDLCDTAVQHSNQWANMPTWSWSLNWLY